MPSAAVAASATSGGINTRSVSAPRLLLWCSDSVQAGAHGVARLGPTGMSLQQASHANCGNSMSSGRLVARQQAALLQGAKHAQALRAAGAAHQRAAERAAEQNRRLERGLRAAVRPSGLCARDDGRR